MIDPQDSQYQVSGEFKPDKELSWPFPAERDGWVLIHNALRGEMKAMREAFNSIRERGQPLQAWEVQAIQTAAAVHIGNIHAHHTIEDDIFAPELRKRFRYPKNLETDHGRLIAKLKDVGDLVGKLKASESKIDELLNAFSEYETMMLPHLKEEEDVGLPLYRAYFTPKDAVPIIQKIVAHSAPHEVGSLIYAQGPEAFREKFMKQEGIPSFVWYIDFKAKYKSFIKVFVENVEALKTGEEPTQDEDCFCIIL